MLPAFNQNIVQVAAQMLEQFLSGKLPNPTEDPIVDQVFV